MPGTATGRHGWPAARTVHSYSGECKRLREKRASLLRGSAVYAGTAAGWFFFEFFCAPDSRQGAPGGIERGSIRYRIRLARLGRVAQPQTASSDAEP
ncbi:hypothetical protein PSP6_580087 [Paraburkholderia tropica]|nr:hypothetical protein PSP6_580087 [Paraburkholderia tropica]